MSTVAIHPPKTPVTQGSHTIAKATIPNICKMPGPPAPFVPAPLPNIAKSEMSPDGFSTTVQIEGNAVGIRGATFQSMGDEASKGTGGGLISANTGGPAKFITPGSMTVLIEGKNVHLLSDPMLNNCGPSGSPPNTGATMMGAQHADLGGEKPCATIDCNKETQRNQFTPPDAAGKQTMVRKTITDKNGRGMSIPDTAPGLPNKCEKEEMCAKIREFNRQAAAGELNNKLSGDAKAKVDKQRSLFLDKVNTAAQKGNPADYGFWSTSEECAAETKKKAESRNYEGFSPDHIKDIGFGGGVTESSNLRWMSSDLNSRAGACTGCFDASQGHTGIKIVGCCD